MAQNGGEINRKSEKVRRANRIIQNRTMILMAVLGVLVFLILIIKLFSLQILRHDELEAKALDQQTRSTEVAATRGTIYDRNGNIMAISATAETVFLSPLEMDRALSDKDNPVAWTKDSVAQKLSEILEINKEGILKKMERTDSQYEVLKLRVEEDVADQIRTFINDEGVVGVYMVTDAKRYYPYATLASQIIGFVGTDNYGLYGLEARYNDVLDGETGLVVSTKDPTGSDMLYGYEQYYKAQNGSDIVLTLDATVQYYVEKALSEMVTSTEAQGATGIVMDVETGAVLAMASSPTYDLNDPSAVYESRLASLVKDGQLNLADAQLRQWRNRAINDTYEPGSTFKVLTLAAALEEGVIDENTTFDCTGSIHVLDATIHCSNRAGHGHQTLEQTAGNSCNPAFITYGLRLGTEKFYRYMKDFGLVNGSGIDLEGEALGIFAPQETASELDLACYAFGQNFNTTPVALISAQAACINGGYLHTPYVVERVVDSEGNVLSSHDSTPVRQVVSEETSALVRQCLEYVVSSGTGRNGQVHGYRIGGKTGTADKGNTGEVVLSFMCFAPADDPKYIMLLTLDSPTGEGRGGGGTVAPYASRIMGEILPYLGVEPSYSAEELLGSDTTVNYVIGMTVADAEEKLKSKGFSVKVVGDGDTVTDQTPEGGTVIPGKSRVILYAGSEKPDTLCTVPSLVGLSPSEANMAVSSAGLLLRFTGTTDSGSGSVRVINQSEAAGAQVEAGTVISVQLSDSGVTD
ncbi:MAG: PASTA domain-containing protein [Oscillospiraceae bacterium]|nr:PASTA domain-containing protein [Oscillospiraceae bacterium]